MDCSSCSASQGAPAMAGMGATMNSPQAAPPPPPPAPVDNAARAQGMAAEGKGQNLNAVV